mmetsp:Transcript_7886/g.23925  ORF Transcript_7886/g.23925 Transcript_7886/m.23925 type:complete len:143 (+) Transcript_7886:295-723(+)
MHPSQSSARAFGKTSARTSALSSPVTLGTMSAASFSSPQLLERRRPSRLLENFQQEFKNPQMLQYFQSIDLDPSEAEGLFRLLDPDDTGIIDAEDFVMGCLRLHGAAKSIDLTVLMCEDRWLRRRWMMNAPHAQRLAQNLSI